MKARLNLSPLLSKLPRLVIGPAKNETRREGWLYLDINPYVSPDIVADMTALPFTDGALSVIHTSHTVEHLWPEEAMRFAAEAFRVLVPGGAMVVAVPDIRIVVNNYLQSPDKDYWLMKIEGGKRTQWDYHRSAWDAWSIKELFEGAGFTTKDIRSFEGLRDTPTMFWMGNA